MNIYFETYSITQTLALIGYIRKADTIYFHKKTWLPLTVNQKIKSIVVKIILAVNKNAKIKSPPLELLNKHNWELNKEAVTVADKMEPDIKGTNIYKTILRIIKDDNIVKYYKTHLTLELSARLLFFKISEELLNLENGNLYIVPKNNDYLFWKKSFDFDAVYERILSLCFYMNIIRDFFLRLRALGIFLSLPIVFFLLNIKKANLRRVKKKPYDLAVPIIWGTHKDNIVTGGIKREHDDSFYYNGALDSSRVVNIYSSWRQSRDIEEGFNKVMEIKNIAYKDSEQFMITPEFIIWFLQIQAKIVKDMLLNAFYLDDNLRVIDYSNKFVFAMLKKLLEIGNVDYKVEILRDDFNPNHIVATIICNRFNRKTVGIQHALNVYDAPQFCFVHLDKYIVYGDNLVETFRPYWDNISLEKTGRETIDWVVNNFNDKNNIERVKSRIARQYKSRKFNVLFTLPNPFNSYNMLKQWDALYDGLNLLKDTDIDFNLFLRFRRSRDLEGFGFTKRFMNLEEADNRFIIDHKNFTTQELMAVSDLVIANSVSFSIFESVAIGRKVFSFDFIGTPAYYFPDYGKDFVLKTADDIVKVFKGLESCFNGFDCNWDKLRVDCNYHYDGNNVKRMQKVFLETIAEVDRDLDDNK